MDRAAAYNLQYLGEAEYSMMLASNFSTDVASMVTRLASAQTLHESDLSTEIDIIQLEQYMDFVRNRLFRQTLLCHREVVLRRPADANSIKSMFVASSATPDAPYVDVQSQESVLFKRPGSTLRTTEPILKAAMLELADQWPQSVSFKDLLRVSRSKIHSAAFLANAATLRAEECKLIDPLMHCFATTHIDLAAERFPFATKVPEFPKTSKLAIYQASHAVAVTNLAHETVHLNDMQRRILVKLTGESDRNGLSLSLMKDVENKELVVQDQGEEVLDMELAKRLVESLIGEELEALTRLKLIYST
jgi:methyltransferase-like protein